MTDVSPLIPTVGIIDTILSKYAKLKAQKAGWFNPVQSDPVYPFPPRAGISIAPAVAPALGRQPTVVKTTWGMLKRRYRDLPGDQFIYGPGLAPPEDEGDAEEDGD
jgi:hypothetical protein